MCSTVLLSIYHHISFFFSLGLLVDKSEVDEGLQTHPRFIACKAHKKDSEGIKCMKNMLVFNTYT